MIGDPYHEPVPVLLNQMIFVAGAFIELNKSGTPALKFGGNYVGEWGTGFECWSAPISKCFPIDVAGDSLG